MAIGHQKRGGSSKSVAKSYRHAFFSFSPRFKSVAIELFSCSVLYDYSVFLLEFLDK
ncbi:uncharacterized protein DS421_19g653050 [Arachis hypogaea]|uniref:Uncharacterized protein n=1 Tax=Arachis hypogaea TaxID=3818 RepID=A0A6B9V9V9_ARAHY|nr:uncharacterized protein DS421_19g653050 [Arachis hypogaea]